MQYQRLPLIVAGGLLSLLGTTSAWAASSNVLQTLYNTEAAYDTDEDVPHFSLDGEFGLVSASGNTETTTLKAGLTSEQETQRWSNNYFAEMLYKQSRIEDGDSTRHDVTAQRFFGYAQMDYKLRTPGQRLFIYGDYEDDRFNGYNYRASIAGGWSQRLWHREASEFRYSVGPGYAFISAESADATNVNNGIIVRASAEYRYRWPTGAKFRQFISTEAGEENIKSRSESTLSANLFGSLAMKLSVILSHESEPAASVKGLNTETSVALVYQFF